MISHTDRFCKNTIKEWGVWFRAPPRRLAGQLKSKWLRDDGDGDWKTKVGKSINTPKSGGLLKLLVWKRIFRREI